MLAAETDWTLVTALLTANGVLAGVVITLWVAYGRARSKYEDLLIKDRDELVPQMVQLAERAATMNTNAEKLLSEAIRLRSLRYGGNPPDGATGA